ncbi:2,4-diaminopentanoate dehydrogenase [Mycolicibacterium vanbaalenii]|uniref:2,4-diaminopentanoate dehydrogenase n=1 Tax=Mycolicibacterium vanbaalenii TaxID=110539 RepID=A0A5S9QZM9_MYCVN|nr:hypothetical protein [Mycolicibacterium vanbaalenii]CAA0124457.1 2,4-diaminopentanoate dehydrogenase [Mycolicibacterium vanbaalenii]
MSIKVVQWGTGWLGTQAVHTLLAHPDLELVGVYTPTAEKVGKDVGDIVGLPKVGVKATDAVDEILALGADCHLFMLLGAEPGTAKPVTERLVKILRAGQNVCQTSLIPMCYPEYAPEELRGPIEAACAEGNSRLFTTGIFPGIINDLMTTPFLACSERVDLVRITEMLNYGEYYGADFARGMGVGGPIPDPKSMEGALAGHDAAGHMSPPIRFLGSRIGAEIDEIRLAGVEFAPAVNRVEVEDLVIEPGSVGAYKLCYEGLSKGRPVVETWFVTRFDYDSASDWPAPRSGSKGCYRIEIEGSLSLKVDIDLMGRRDSPSQTRGFPTSGAALGANLLGASAAVNAIPLVLKLDPGVYGMSDLHHNGDLRLFSGL